MKKYLISLFLIFGIVTPVNAENSVCDTSEINRLTNIAQNVTITNEYVGDLTNEFGYNISGNFNILISGLTEDILIKINDFETLSSEDTVNDVLILPGYQYGTYTFNIVPYGECDTVLKTLSINIPKFNKYSLDERCKDIDIEEFTLCDPWYQYDITESNFTTRLEEYKISKQNNSSIEDPTSEETIPVKTNSFIAFFDKYKLYIIIGFCLLASITSIVVLYRRYERRKLG